MGRRVKFSGRYGEDISRDRDTGVSPVRIVGNYGYIDFSDLSAVGTGETPVSH